MKQARRDTHVWFRDITEDWAVRWDADCVPELRIGFEKLAFRSIGFLGEYQVPGGSLWVHEVLASPKADAFLTLTLSPEHPLKREPRTIPTAILESGLEDGAIIITTNSPEHLWRLNHPKAGVYLEGWSEANPEELWRHHQQRVEDLALERDSAILRHVSMRLRLWIAERCNEVGNHVAVLALLFGVVAFVVGILIPFVRLVDWLDARFRGWLGVFWPLFWFVAIFAIVVLGWWIARSRVVRGWLVGQWFARRFPWPGRRPYHATAEEDATATTRR